MSEGVNVDAFRAQRAEDAINLEIRHLQNVLGGLLNELTEHPNSRDMLSAWTRRVTAYTRSDGQKINGKPDYRTVVSIDRLEHSIEDAKWWLRKLDEGPIGGPVGSR